MTHAIQHYINAKRNENLGSLISRVYGLPEKTKALTYNSLIDRYGSLIESARIKLEGVDGIEEKIREAEENALTKEINFIMRAGKSLDVFTAKERHPKVYGAISKLGYSWVEFLKKNGVNYERYCKKIGTPLLGPLDIIKEINILAKEDGFSYNKFLNGHRPLAVAANKRYGSAKVAYILATYDNGKEAELSATEKRDGSNIYSQAELLGKVIPRVWPMLGKNKDDLFYLINKVMLGRIVKLNKFKNHILEGKPVNLHNRLEVESIEREYDIELNDDIIKIQLKLESGSSKDLPGYNMRKVVASKNVALMGVSLMDMDYPVKSNSINLLGNNIYLPLEFFQTEENWLRRIGFQESWVREHRRLRNLEFRVNRKA